MVGVVVAIPVVIAEFHGLEAEGVPGDLAIGIGVGIEGVIGRRETGGVSGRAVGSHHVPAEAQPLIRLKDEAFIHAAIRVVGAEVHFDGLHTGGILGQRGAP